MRRMAQRIPTTFWLSAHVFCARKHALFSLNQLFVSYWTTKSIWLRLYEILCDAEEKIGIDQNICYVFCETQRKVKMQLGINRCREHNDVYKKIYTQLNIVFVYKRVRNTQILGSALSAARTISKTFQSALIIIWNTIWCFGSNCN